MYPEVLITHTDAPDLYVWNVMRLSVREERQVNGKKMHLSDLILMGHRQNAEYALAASQIEPKIASGGRDGQVSPECSVICRMSIKPVYGFRYWSGI